MTPEKFIATWKDNSLTEKGGAQPHFEDLCRLLDVDPPRQYREYCYEQDLKKMHGGNGFADVWKRGCFAWENKGPDKDLGPALMQLKNYAGALDNPPVLVVCNRERIEIHPCFTGYPSTPRVILLEDIGQPENLQALRWLFSPEDIHKLRPLKSNAAITAEAAGEFAKVAKAMRGRGLDSQQVAHFLIQCIFCMYAEDEGLLHEGISDDPQIFTAILKSARDDTERATKRIANLFTAMQNGGAYGNDDIAWFNGGLFKVIDVPPLEADDLAALREAAEKLDWRAIDPTIFGTLFERGLDPDARAPLGAHYTDVETIAKLIRPLIVEPLATEWEAVKPLLQKAQGKGPRSAPWKAAMPAFQSYLERLKNFRVLDPACGSGNFLYLAMHALKDLEHAAQVDAELLGFGRQIGIETGPANIFGLEINEYAAELARVTVWIGDIQWSQRNGQPIARNPILRTLDGIQHRDALMNADGSEAAWPAADVIVGNPPFLGDKKMRGELGGEYTERLRKLYAGKVPGGADLVCYWFHKAREQILADQAQRAGLVSTNSIRGGANRKVLDAIAEDLAIFNAWGDEDWINDGAAVRVSLVAFAAAVPEGGAWLDGQQVGRINPDLTASEAGSNAHIDVSQAKPLPGNAKTAFNGIQKTGAFDIPGELAREWLLLPANPNGRPNADVLNPYLNGMDMTRRARDMWLINTGWEMDEMAASLYEQPFDYLVREVKPVRATNSLAALRDNWWRLWRPRPEMQEQIRVLPRYIVTPEVSKPGLWLAGTAGAARQEPDRGCPRRRHHLRYLAFALPRVLVTASWHRPGRSPALHSQQHLRDLPIPGRDDTNRHQGPAGSRGRPAAAAGHHCAPAGSGEDRQRRTAPGHPARQLAEPGRVGGACAGSGRRLPRAHHRQARARRRAEEAHPDQPLQCPPGLARQCPQGARQGRGRSLRLDGLHAGDERRGDPAPPAGAQPGTQCLSRLLREIQGQTS
nr:DNA methyltransferase [Stutzerimonas kunmingensis]